MMEKNSTKLRSLKFLHNITARVSTLSCSLLLSDMRHKRSVFLIDQAYEWDNLTNFRDVLCECGFKVVLTVAELVKHIDKSVLTAQVSPKARPQNVTQATVLTCWKLRQHGAVESLWPGLRPSRPFFEAQDSCKLLAH